MRKPKFCICENKGADQLCSKCEADQRHCFRYTHSTIPLLSKSKFPFSVTVQLGLCRTWSQAKKEKKNVLDCQNDDFRMFTGILAIENVVLAAGN